MRLCTTYAWSLHVLRGGKVQIGFSMKLQGRSAGLRRAFAGRNKSTSGALQKEGLSNESLWNTSRQMPTVLFVENLRSDDHPFKVIVYIPSLCRRSTSRGPLLNL